MPDDALESVLRLVSEGRLTAEEAAKDVRADLIKPLAKPVTITLDGTRYVLGPDQLKVRADIDGMVSDALVASREEALPGRVWRYLTGGEVEETIEPTVTYDTGDAATATKITGYTLPGNFGQATRTRDPRQTQFGLKILF